MARDTLSEITELSVFGCGRSKRWVPSWHTELFRYYILSEGAYSNLINNGNLSLSGTLSYGRQVELRTPQLLQKISAKVCAHSSSTRLAQFLAQVSKVFTTRIETWTEQSPIRLDLFKLHGALIA